MAGVARLELRAAEEAETAACGPVVRKRIPRIARTSATVPMREAFGGMQAGGLEYFSANMAWTRACSECRSAVASDVNTMGNSYLT